MSAPTSPSDAIGGEAAHARASVSGAAVPTANVLRKAVNTLAVTPKSARITALGRKSYNVLLHHAQNQGLDRDRFRAPLDAIVRALNFDSHDHGLIKKHLRAMVSTLVEWQSPTTGEGSTWNVSGLLAHAALTKERGQVWLEWSYAVNLKQELIEPAVFARLKLDVLSRLHTHAGIALYEICMRYRDVGRTARQQWRWWYPVLSGNPPSDKLERLEYRVFKRDTLRPAIAEVNAITDLDVELVEHRKGRFVDELQFVVSRKRATVLALTAGAVVEPADPALVRRASALGVTAEEAAELAAKHGGQPFADALDAVERRAASAYPQPLHNPPRYFRSLLGANDTVRDESRPAASSAESPVATEAGALEDAQRRRLRWQTDWTRQAHERCAAAIEALSADTQRELEQALLATLRERQAHPSIGKRLQVSGWRHPLVRHEMLRFFGDATYPAGWDVPPREGSPGAGVDPSSQGFGDG